MAAGRAAGDARIFAFLPFLGTERPRITRLVGEPACKAGGTERRRRDRQGSRLAIGKIFGDGQDDQERNLGGATGLDHPPCFARELPRELSGVPLYF